MRAMDKLTYSYEHEYDKYPDTPHKELVKKVDKYNAYKGRVEPLLADIKK